ncbi:UNVERIFIED_CONTAM: Cytokinin hydroxylase [Sesamum latifolium]|uniref:Cytokinin hydroxylase n=1 Tax=Sesamum latifolium TaxID=2727402 RepID=A0AAW2X8Q4_9LAMI
MATIGTTSDTSWRRHSLATNLRAMRAWWIALSRCSNRWRKAVEKGQAEFEIGEHMTRLTADIISRTEFDSNYERESDIPSALPSANIFVLEHRHLCFLSRKLRGDRPEQFLRQRFARNAAQRMQKKRSGNGFSLNLQLIMDDAKRSFFAGHETTRAANLDGDAAGEQPDLAGKG